MLRTIKDGECDKRTGLKELPLFVLGKLLTVLFCAGVYDARVCMCKLGELDSVLFAEEALLVASLFAIVDLNRLVASRGHEELTVVVVVD